MVFAAPRGEVRPETASLKTFSRTIAPVLVFALAIVMTYGFEIFSFHLTLDEDLFGEYPSGGYAQIWLTQGRWAMAFLTLLIPSPVVPVVSTLLGVGLTAVAIWILCRKFFEMDPWAAAGAAALACTLPTLAFMFSFATIAYGVGLGNILLVGYLAAISSESWRYRALSVVPLAFAIGIYDSFLPAAAALAVALICKRPAWLTAAIAVASLGLAYALSKMIASISQMVFGVTQDAYAGQYIDIAGLVADPAARLRRALGAVWDVVSLSVDRFGLHSPWLAVVLAALLVLAALGAARAPGLQGKLLNFGGLAAIVLIPVIVELVPPEPVLLRSMVYFPVVIAVLAGLAVKGLGFFRPRLAGAGLCVLGAVAVLAVVGQATIANRLFAASEMTYARDQNIAFTIGMEKARLVGPSVLDTVPIYVSGTHQWVPSLLVPAKETLGVSFFAGLGGPDALNIRTLTFLRSQGVDVRMPEEAEIATSLTNVASMPSYPQPGWIAYTEGVLILNFGSNAAQ